VRRPSFSPRRPHFPQQYGGRPAETWIVFFSPDLNGNLPPFLGRACSWVHDVVGPSQGPFFPFAGFFLGNEPFCRPPRGSVLFPRFPFPGRKQTLYSYKFPEHRGDLSTGFQAFFLIPPRNISVSRGGQIPRFRCSPSHRPNKHFFSKGEILVTHHGGLEPLPYSAG